MILALTLDKFLLIILWQKTSRYWFSIEKYNVKLLRANRGSTMKELNHMNSSRYSTYLVHCELYSVVSVTTNWMIK